MYKMDTRVRYSECNSKGRASLSAILDYLQDCCTFQSEDLGIGVEYLMEKQCAWILSSWQVDIERYPVMGEYIIVKTIPYEIKGIYGMRNFIIEDSEGNSIVKANSIWVYMDMRSMKPVKAEADFAKKYKLEEKIDMEYLGRKLPKFPEGRAMELKKVPDYYIDTNNHVNNSKYILFGQEYLPKDIQVKRIWAEYKKPAMKNDDIMAKVSDYEGNIAMSIEDGKGTVYAKMIYEG